MTVGEAERHARNVKACDALKALLELHHSGAIPDPAKEAKRAPDPVEIRHKDIFPSRPEPPALSVIHTNAITVASIQNAVCVAFDMKKIRLLSRRRTQNIVRPRQVSMWFCREYTTRSFPQIARFHGLTDHSTSLHACRVVDRLIAESGEIAKKVREIANILGVEIEGIDAR